MAALVLCMWCHAEIREGHTCLTVRPRADEHAEALAAKLDASVQALSLASALVEEAARPCRPLWQEVSAMADLGSELHRAALRWAAERIRNAGMGAVGLVQ